MHCRRVLSPLCRHAFAMRFHGYSSPPLAITGNIAITVASLLGSRWRAELEIHSLGVAVPDRHLLHLLAELLVPGLDLIGARGEIRDREFAVLLRHEEERVGCHH